MAFYGDVFGWTFEDYSAFVDAPYWGVVTGEEGTPGLNGGLPKRPAPAPDPGQGTNAWVVTMQVDDFVFAGGRHLGPCHRRADHRNPGLRTCLRTVTRRALSKAFEAGHDGVIHSDNAAKLIHSECRTQLRPQGELT